MSQAGTPLYPGKTIAKLFNLTERRVQQLAKDGIIPKAERGKYELIGSVQGYVKYLQDRAIGQHDPSPTGLADEKIRLTRAQADEKELQVSILKRELIPAPEIIEAWSEMVGTIRARLLALPGRLANRVMSFENVRDAEDYAREEVYSALQELGDAGTAEAP
jgi:phage terminase Nu1 subunit (DNA packaging protein)